MSFLPQAELDPSFPPFAVLRENFGFVPRLFRAQAILPRLIEAEAALMSAILFQEQRLSRTQKEMLLLALAAARGDAYWTAAHHQMLQLLGVPETRLDRMLEDYRQAGLQPEDIALLRFVLKLGLNGASISRAGVDYLSNSGIDGVRVLEAVLVAALSHFLCTLAAGIGAAPDFQPRPATPYIDPDMDAPAAGGGDGPYLQAVAETGAILPMFRELFGFIPNVFRTQAVKGDVLEAEARAIQAILLSETHLSRVQKERVSLAVSIANRNVYYVTFHSGMLESLGASAGLEALAGADRALLDGALKLAAAPRDFGAADIETLQSHGLTAGQILEAVAAAALAGFLNTVQFGLGAAPDFPPRQIPNLPAFRLRHKDRSLPPDADAALVSSAQGGDLDAFEQLIHRHGQRVYRTLLGICGDPEEARDAMQDTLLKSFEHLGAFQGRSKFSTWLLSIAYNTGVQRLRERRHLEPLDDEDTAAGDGFRPRQVQAWTDDPEQLYSLSERRKLVESSVMRLPAKYRLVVMLRDIEQLSNEETAAALGLGLPAVKSRLLRGRLMLREALAPHFAGRARGALS